MKESVNNINITGIVSEINIRDIIKEDRTYIAGDVIVEVPSKDGVSLIPVGFISANKKKDGGENKNYINLQKLKEYNSIASAGRATATKVQISGASLSENIFMPQGADDVITGIRISSNFFTKISDSQYKPEATFAISGYIVKITPEIKVINEVETETGRLIIFLAIVGYADKTEVIKIIAEEPQHVTYIKANWKEGDTIRAGGQIRFTEETIERVQDASELGFGEPEVKKYTKKVRELIITQGSPAAIDAEMAYTKEDIQAGLVQRQARVEDVKRKATERVQVAQATASTDFGF